MECKTNFCLKKSLFFRRMLSWQIISYDGDVIFVEEFLGSVLVERADDGVGNHWFSKAFCVTFTKPPPVFSTSVYFSLEWRLWCYALVLSDLIILFTSWWQKQLTGESTHPSRFFWWSMSGIFRVQWSWDLTIALMSTRFAKFLCLEELFSLPRGAGLMGLQGGHRRLC